MYHKKINVKQHYDENMEYEPPTYSNKTPTPRSLVTFISVYISYLNQILLNNIDYPDKFNLTQITPNFKMYYLFLINIHFKA